MVVSDGGSSDETVERAAATDCILVVSDPGRGVQLNAGAAKASGDIYLFLHADARLNFDGCQQIRELVGDGGQDLCGVFQQQIENKKLIYRLIEFGNRIRVTCFSMAYGDQGIFVGSQLFDSIGGFPNWPLMEDFDFSRRLRKQSRYKLLKGPLIVHPRRWEENGPLRQTFANWKTVARFLTGTRPDVLSRDYQSRKNDQP